MDAAMDAVMDVATLDTALVLVVVGIAVAWLVSRFVHKKAGSSSSGTVVVGASLQRGLDRAKRKKSR